MERELIIFVGIPASGKSTFYDTHFKETHLRINLDMLNTRNREWAIFEAAIKFKTAVVIDNTGITKKIRNKFLSAVTREYKKIAYYFTTPPNVCFDRNSSRERVVPDVAMKGMLRDLSVPDFEEGFDEIHFVNEFGEVTTLDKREQ